MGHYKEFSRKEFTERLRGMIPDFEIELKADLAQRINELKKEKDAIILGHNYMEAALYHGVADITGDSLQLCREAAKTDASIIVFCGVEFMAETAKLLNPAKKVLLPAAKAGCSLASSIKASDVRALKEKFPGVPVVTYINTYAEVKAECDICCTSGNAAKIVESLDSDAVIFLPDEYLAKNVARQTGKKIIFPESAGSLTKGEKTFIGWHGKCEVHDKFTVQDIEDVRKQYPNVSVVAHPECPPDVCSAADFSGSTAKMIEHVRNTNADQYLLLTECAMGDNIIAENRDKEVLRLCSHRCPHMAQITLEDTLAALENMQYEINVDDRIAPKAIRSIERMLEVH